MSVEVGVDMVAGLAALLVAALGGAAAALALTSRRGSAAGPPQSPVVPTLPSGDAVVLAVLGTAAVLLDSDDRVVVANPVARTSGIVRDDALGVAELRRLVRFARSSGEPHDVEMELPAGRLRREPASVRARATAVDDGCVVLLVEDVTETRRVEQVRRDFVANVSHELKTPVGALALLGEALLDASDEPQAVRRFAARVQHESARLVRLVQEILDLSRLQGADPLPDGDVISVDRVVSEAVDRTRLPAAARAISVVTGGDSGATVLGSETQLVTALVNLIDNAVHYSPERTRVAVGVRLVDDGVEVSVSDQGIGIAEVELERVFERFYRADPARSRDTGGTGLGLAIVKHVATNHGGSVTVWSRPGSGSTFTLHLPRSVALTPAGPPPAGTPPSGKRPSGKRPAGKRVPA